MYVGLGATPTVESCRENFCVDPACWKLYKTQCDEWMQAQFLLGCLEDNCARPECKENFPDECARGTGKRPIDKKVWLFVGAGVLTMIAGSLWLGRKTRAR